MGDGCVVGRVRVGQAAVGSCVVTAVGPVEKMWVVDGSVVCWVGSTVVEDSGPPVDGGVVGGGPVVVAVVRTLVVTVGIVVGKLMVEGESSQGKMQTLSTAASKAGVAP